MKFRYRLLIAAIFGLLQLLVDLYVFHSPPTPVFHWVVWMMGYLTGEAIHWLVPSPKEINRG